MILSFSSHFNGFHSDKMSTLTTKLLHLLSTPSFTSNLLNHKTKLLSTLHHLYSITFHEHKYHHFNEIILLIFCFPFLVNRIFHAKQSNWKLVKLLHSLIGLIIVLNNQHLIVQRDFSSRAAVHYPFQDHHKHNHQHQHHQQHHYLLHRVTQ